MILFDVINAIADTLKNGIPSTHTDKIVVYNYRPSSFDISDGALEGIIAVYHNSTAYNMRDRVSYDNVTNVGIDCLGIGLSGDDEGEKTAEMVARELVQQVMRTLTKSTELDDAFGLSTNGDPPVLTKSGVEGFDAIDPSYFNITEDVRAYNIRYMFGINDDIILAESSETLSAYNTTMEIRRQ